MTLLQDNPKSRPVAPARGADLTHRDLSWFSQRIERGRKEEFVEIVTITPEIAKRLLEANEGNRGIDKALIRVISSDIKRGHWKLNGETIIVARDGELNDGQHRLLAVIEADTPIRTAVMFGVDRGSRYTVDMGKARGAAQFLDMKGVTQPHRLAAIVRLHLGFSTGRVHGSRSGSTARAGMNFTKQDVLTEFNQHQDEFENAFRHVGTTPFAMSQHGGPTFLPVAYLNVRRVDPLGADTFFDMMKYGVNLERSDPILWLRAKLFETSSTRKDIRSEHRLEYVLRYWNAWAEDRALRSAIKMTGLEYPKILPSAMAK